MASGVVAALSKKGISVPGDISVLSTDGFNLAEIHDVQLTAVHVPRDELGTEAIALLQRRMLRPDAPCTNQLLQGKLVVRDSVRKASSRAVTPRAHQLYDQQI